MLKLFTLFTFTLFFPTSSYFLINSRHVTTSRRPDHQSYIICDKGKHDYNIYISHTITQTTNKAYRVNHLKTQKGMIYKTHGYIFN